MGHDMDDIILAATPMEDKEFVRLGQFVERLNLTTRQMLLSTLVHMVPEEFEQASRQRHRNSVIEVDDEG